MHPAWQGQGIATALTGRLVGMADGAGIELAALSTYIDNVASQKVSGAFGFVPGAGFAFCEGKLESVLPHAAESPRVVEVSRAEARERMLASESLAAGGGYLPHSWRFYPFHRDPELALSRMERLYGIRDGGGLAALLCCGDRTPHGDASFSIDFLEGAPEAMAELVKHTLAQSARREVPRGDGPVPGRAGAAVAERAARRRFPGVERGPP